MVLSFKQLQICIYFLKVNSKHDDFFWRHRYRVKAWSTRTQKQQHPEAKTPTLLPSSMEENVHNYHQEEDGTISHPP